MTFGEKLYELRKSSGLSQEQLAEKCSIESHITIIFSGGIEVK